jgi:Rab GDP dissociation inhibitor|eukprot:TRINITY_DN951_c0_g1_i1.p1 TRINITY_DN951_c0_g1~~TRINITY_DN951_c0_g1_i1.p1  ORF type:complete len:479 (-),score=91.43 TRINITY_DN951_c0_g1_i1:149-1519(-)
MDEEYDVIVCGTGLKECILSGLLSVSGQKVLHLDRNNYYGGECASLNITNLWEKFRPGTEPPKELGVNRDWNVDLVPKFIMASGNLVKILLKTKVSRYLEWKSCDRSYVYQPTEGGFFSSGKAIHSVPTTPAEGVKSGLMGILEKPRFVKFVQFITNWNDADPSTFQGLDPKRHTMKQVFEKFGLQLATVEFIGHAVALNPSDEYLGMACGQTIAKCKLYLESLMQYGGSPFIYPIYGLGGLPEGFSRLAAINRGTYMLNKPVDGFVYDDAGKVCGVKSGDEVAKCKLVICDPSYAPPNKSQVMSKIIRCICILSAPIPETRKVDGSAALSCQIILPQSQLKRKNDIYVMMVSWAHMIAAKDRYVAIVSTTVETSDPETEIQPALALLGPITEKFINISDYSAPLDDGSNDQVFVTSSYDPTSHFEDASNEVLAMWKTITGADLDLTYVADPEDDA